MIPNRTATNKMCKLLNESCYPSNVELNRCGGLKIPCMVNIANWQCSIASSGTNNISMNVLDKFNGSLPVRFLIFLYIQVKLLAWWCCLRGGQELIRHVRINSLGTINIQSQCHVICPVFVECYRSTKFEDI